MNVRQLQREAAQHAGHVEDDSAGDERTYQCCAPRGHVWAGAGLHMLRVSWCDCSEKDAALQDAIDRMRYCCPAKTQESHTPMNHTPRGEGIMKYELMENGCVFATIEAESAKQALEAEDPDRADYGDADGTVWTTWHARRVGESDWEESRTVQMDPEEPDCSSDDGHDWQSPFEIVGGIKENPGVRGHGGGVTIDECCMHCGCRKHIDTWAQRPDDGTQGHTTVTYTPGHYSEQLAAEETP